jgi:hypothetical protein
MGVRCHADHRPGAAGSRWLIADARSAELSPRMMITLIVDDENTNYNGLSW